MGCAVVAPSGVRRKRKVSPLCLSTDGEFHLSSQKGWVYPMSLRDLRISSIAVYVGRT